MIRYCIVAFLVLCSSVAAAQALPRTADGKPDFTGIWRVQNRAAVNLEAHVASFEEPPGMGVVEGGMLPYTAEARRRQQENFAARRDRDPLRQCFLPGIPRIMALEHPFQVTQTPEAIAMTFEWQQVFRFISLDGEPSAYEGIEAWMGRAEGRWEDDVLVVRVRDFNDKTWFDAAGNFHSAALELTERYRLLDADTIEYTVTVEDPEVFTRPWTMRMTLHRQTHLDRVLEYQCQAEKEEFTGDFERDERTWYPARVRDDYALFDAEAGDELPEPVVPDSVARTTLGRPDIGGWYMADAGGANYGLEQSDGGFLLPPARAQDW